MSDNFDAYHKWLGIAPKDQPPNHYRLLGLDRFESDPEVIHAAAQRTAAFVKSNGTGPHAELAAKLLDRIRIAHKILVDARTREAYDSGLDDSSVSTVAMPPPPRRWRRR